MERALASRRFGPYTLQAAIAAVHAGAASADATDWARDRRAVRRAVAQSEPSPVVELNRAVAVAMRDGPAAGLALVDAHPRPRRPRRTTASRTPRAPTCAAGWARRPRPARPTSARSPSPGRSRSGASSSGGWPSCATSAPGASIDALPVRPRDGPRLPREPAMKIPVSDPCGEGHGATDGGRGGRALRGVPEVHRGDPRERPPRRLQPAAAACHRDHGPGAAGQTSR